MKTSLLVRTLTAALLLPTSPARAGDLPCDDSILATSDEYRIGGDGTGYWMQALGACRLTYTQEGGFGSQMYNLCTHKQEKIGDDIDAFPVPGTNGEVHVHPGLSFYRTRDVLAAKDPNAVQPFFTDDTLSDYYESLGLLSSLKGVSKVRVTTGEDGSVLRDYSVQKVGDDFKVVPLGPKHSTCKKQLDSSQIGISSHVGVVSYQIGIELPMLSRDGSMIAFRDYASQKTVIYRLNKDDPEDCTLAFTIPELTGKVSFSFDNKHVGYVSISGLNAGRAKEVDITNGKYRTFSGPLEMAHFVTQREDGSFFYSKSTFGSLEPNLVRISENAVPEPDTPEAKKAEALGALWAKSCNQSLDSGYLITVGSRMNAESCRNALKLLDAAAPSELSKQELTAYCDRIRATTSPLPPDTIVAPPTSPTNAAPAQ